MNKLNVITAALSVIITLAILNNSEAYITSLTAKRDQQRKASNIRYLQKLKRMKLRLARELESNDAFEKKVAYFKRWLRKFERKVCVVSTFNYGPSLNIGLYYPVEVELTQRRVSRSLSQNHR